MKKINIVIYLILFAVFFTGCNNERSAYNRLEEQFKNCLNTVEKTQEIATPVYMVIPRAGCSGCISTAEEYAINCLQDPNHYKYVTFILTDFDSEKTLRARFGAWYKSNKLIIDKENVFNANQSLKSSYPTIFFFDKDSNLVKVSECSPTKNGLGDIALFAHNNKFH